MVWRRDHVKVSIFFGADASEVGGGEARVFGFSTAEAEELMTRSAAAGDVIDAKQTSFQEKPEGKRLPNMNPEALYRTIKEMEAPRFRVTSA
jgi:hypothetical protein